MKFESKILDDRLEIKILAKNIWYNFLYISFGLSMLIPGLLLGFYGFVASCYNLLSNGTDLINVFGFLLFTVVVGYFLLVFIECLGWHFKGYEKMVIDKAGDEFSFIRFGFKGLYRFEQPLKEIEFIGLKADRKYLYPKEEVNFGRQGWSLGFNGGALCFVCKMKMITFGASLNKSEIEEVKLMICKFMKE